MKFIHEDLELEIPEEIYYPAEDSFLLADAIEELELKGKKVLEIGCGSGFLSLLCASKGSDVTACDITDEAVEATKANATNNRLKISVLQSDLFENIHGRYDFIIFNPPYLPKDDEESHVTYTGGIEIVGKFIYQCKEHLSDGGKILLLVSTLTGKDEVLSLFNEKGFFVKIVAKEKLDWEELIVIEASYGQHS